MGQQVEVLVRFLREMICVLIVSSEVTHELRIHQAVENSPGPYRPPMLNHLANDKRWPRKMPKSCFCHFRPIFVDLGPGVFFCPLGGRVVLNT